MCVFIVTGPRLLTVLGRDVTLEKTCGSIADCTFDELCGRVSVLSNHLFPYKSQFASLQALLYVIEKQRFQELHNNAYS